MSSARRERWDEFSEQLVTRKAELADLLPDEVSPERFIASATAAVRQNTRLLDTTPRSLFGAVTKAAQDGLQPDGREGVILPFKNKTSVQDEVSGQWRDVWELDANWMPMTEGLRKRARRLDGIIVTAEVVYANDAFELTHGDDPRLEHAPPPLGTDRGDGIGVYAIFRDRNGQILHREVMDALQVEDVRQQSKQPNALVWTKFWTEGWRKSAIRRGFKSVPVGAELERIIRRDDVMYEFDDGAAAAPVGLAAPVGDPSAAPPERRRRRRPPAEVVRGGTNRALPPAVGEARRPATDEPPATETPAERDSSGGDDDLPDDLREDHAEWLAAHESAPEGGPPPAEHPRREDTAR